MNENFPSRRFKCFQIPKSYSLKAAGPIFCSGITMYTPLKQWGALKGGMNVGVVGIGGLGQVDLYILCSPNTSGEGRLSGILVHATSDRAAFI